MLLRIAELKHVGVIAVASMLFSCGDDTTTDVRPLDSGRASGLDAGLDAAFSDFDTENSDAGISESVDLIEDMNVDEPDPRGPWSASPWLVSQQCRSVDREAGLSQEEAFEKPNRQVFYNQKVTRVEYLAEGYPSRFTYSLRPSLELSPARARPHNLYAETGQDLDFSFYVQHPRTSEMLEQTKINVVMMVDYEPTDALYRRFDSERESPIFEEVTTGLAFTATSDVEIMDIEIPATEFDEAGVYDIAFAFESSYPGGKKWGGNYRMTLYYGAYDSPKTFCARNQLGSDENLWEYWLWRRHISDDWAGLLHPELPFNDDPTKRPVVAAGDTLRLYWSLFRLHYSEQRYVASVPLLNGKPIVDAIWSTTGTNLRAYMSSEQTVDDRGYFDVTFPEEPGLHEVMLASWVDPFVPAETLDGELIEGVEWGRRVAENSSVAEFVVE